MKKISQIATIGLFAAVFPLSAQVSTSFNIDLSPDAQNFAVNSTTGFQLDYTIDGSGNVSLDAVVISGGAARWNQIDNASAGTTTSSALFNTSFTLTYSGTADAILTAQTNYGNAGSGSVLSTKGQGNQNALESGESMTFTVSGTSTAVAGFSLGLEEIYLDHRLGNGQSSFGVETTPTNFVEALVPLGSGNGLVGPRAFNQDLSSITLSAAGESMTFRTIEGNAGGIGLSGFDFSVSASAVPEPSATSLILGTLAMSFMFLRRRRA